MIYSRICNITVNVLFTDGDACRLFVLLRSMCFDSCIILLSIDRIIATYYFIVTDDDVCPLFVLWFFIVCQILVSMCSKFFHSCIILVTDDDACRIFILLCSMFFYSFLILVSIDLKIAICIHILKIHKSISLVEYMHVSIYLDFLKYEFEFIFLFHHFPLCNCILIIYITSVNKKRI